MEQYADLFAGMYLSIAWSFSFLKTLFESVIVFSPAGGSNKTIKTTNIGSAKNRNVLYNCTKNNMVQRKKVGRLTKTREPDEEKEAVSFWMPTFTLRIVVIQIHWAVNLLTLILNFLVTIYSFLCLGGEVLCQIFMGLSCEFQCEHWLWLVTKHPLARLLPTVAAFLNLTFWHVWVMLPFDIKWRPNLSFGPICGNVLDKNSF